jgi:hypothetical protein
MQDWCGRRVHTSLYDFRDRTFLCHPSVIYSLSGYRVVPPNIVRSSSAARSVAGVRPVAVHSSSSFPRLATFVMMASVNVCAILVTTSRSEDIQSQTTIRSQWSLPTFRHTYHPLSIVSSLGTLLDIVFFVFVSARRASRTF